MYERWYTALLKSGFTFTTFRARYSSMNTMATELHYRIKIPRVSFQRHYHVLEEQAYRIIL
jgi:hypothetical protein